MFKKHKFIIQSILEKFGNRLPTLFELNTSSLFKYLILISLEKLIQFCDVADLQKFLKLNQIYIFIAKLCKNNDIMIVAICLMTIEALFQKIPEVYVIMMREGVIDFIKSLTDPTQVMRLEAYSIVPRKHNPNEILK